MSESLIIEGKQYISSRRAAEIAGYSNDYVGQLCRAGKLACKMVGRFWYIDETSILQHKKDSLKPNQTVFKKIDTSSDALTSNVELFPAAQSVSQNLESSMAIEPPPVWNWINLSDTKKPSLVRSPYTLISPTIAALLFLLVMVATGNARFHSVSTGNASVASVTAGARTAGQAVVSVWNSLCSEVEFLASEVHFGPENVPNDSNQTQPFQEPSANSVIPPDEIGKVTSEHGGLVILPQQASSTDDAKLEKSIQNSFSDTVVVKPNSDGTTGVIQPIFRTVAGHDFLYVLVPVKATSTPVDQ